MMHLDPAKRVVLPVLVSLRSDVVHLLDELAIDMDLSIDELFSAIVEEAAFGLEKSSKFGEDIVIPDQCSMKDLLDLIRS